MDPEDKDLEDITDEVDESIDQQQKQGHSFCFCCCDVRRATIVVNLINILSSIITLASVVEVHREAQELEETGNEDEISGIHQMKEGMQAIVVIAIIGWLLSFAAIWGALKFRFFPILINVIYMVVSFFASGVILTITSRQHEPFEFYALNWIINAISTGIYIYPQIMYLLEVRSGILSAETYDREKKWCCR